MKNALEDHVRKQHTFEESLICLVCGLNSCKTSEQLLDHAKIHQDLKFLSCCVCGKYEDSHEKLEAHIKKHGEGSNFDLLADFVPEKEHFYNCELKDCEQSFVSEKELESHKCGIHMCTLCCCMYRTQEQLNDHMNIYHNANKPDSDTEESGSEGILSKEVSEQKCCWCHKTFRNRQLHAKHMRDSHNIVMPKTGKAQRVTFSTKKPVNLKSDDLNVTIEGVMDDYQIDSEKQMLNFDHSSERTKLSICLKCEETFNSPEDLRDHISTHETKSFICLECGHEFNLVSDLEGHYEKHHVDRKPLLCSLCGKCFMKDKELQQHLEEHDSSKQTCTVCFKEVANSWQLSRHMELNHGGDSDDEIQNDDVSKNTFDKTCRVCGHGVLNKTALARHLMEMHRERPMPKFKGQINECTLCDKQFLMRVSLQKHLQNIHHVKISTADAALVSKMTVLNNDFKYHCPVCKRGYNEITSVARHMRATHGEDMDGIPSDLFGYECGLCDQEFLSHQDMFMHVYTHIESEGSYFCTKCSIVFDTEEQLRIHLAVHVPTNIAPNCEQCLEELPTQLSHNNHKCGDTEDEEPKLYPCEKCPEGFDSHYQLSIHMLNAHPKRRGRPRKYNKEVVAKKVPNPLHITSRKNFQCKICGCGFLLKGNLNRHWHLYHRAEETYLCELCGDVSTDQNNLDQHHEYIHGSVQMQRMLTYTSLIFILF